MIVLVVVQVVIKVVVEEVVLSCSSQLVVVETVQSSMSGDRYIL